MRPRSWLLFITVYAVSFPIQAQAQSQWIAGTGDWHDPANWNMGVPTSTRDAAVKQGEAQFAVSASTGSLSVGGSFGDARVVGTANLTAFDDVDVGFASGTGGIVSTITGVLAISAGDLAVSSDRLVVGSGGGTGTNTSLTGIGSVNVVGGDIVVDDSVDVGVASGTGTKTTLRGTGALSVTNGNLSVRHRLSIGDSGGAGTATGIADGSVAVEHGDVIVLPSGSFASSLSIGAFTGTSSYRGQGTGALTLVDGRVVVDSVSIGSSAGGQGSSNGRLTIRHGELITKSLVVGGRFDIQGRAIGLVELLRSRATGQRLRLNDEGKLVLGIGGSQPGDYGQMMISATAILDGDFEARFIDGFQPSPGDVFDLITAGAITDRYALTITGINPIDYPNMVITRNSNLLRVAFVPEPSGIALAFGLLAFATQCKKRPAAQN